MDIDAKDWALWQAFAAVAETGSLSAGAAKLGISQPTMGRHIARLETALSEQLFIRHPKGLRLTTLGFDALPHVRTMQQSLAALETQLANHSDDISGAVRITSSEMVCHKILPPILRNLRSAHPALSIDVVANDQSENLLFGDADIAIRLYRPNQIDLVAQHLGQLEVGLFASARHLKITAPVRSIEDIARYNLIGFDADTRMIDGMQDAGIPITRDNFCIRTDSSVLQWDMVRAGCGIGLGLRTVGQADPDLVEIEIPMPQRPTMPVWLATSARARQSLRIRTVWAALSEGLASYLIPS